jgi:hypothetical protein
MDVKEAKKAFDKASADYSEALAENDRITETLRVQEAKRVTGLREAEKVELEESSKVFESLGMPKDAATFAARGRAA